MKDKDGNTMITLKDIGWGMIIASFVLLFLLQTTRGQVQWVVPALFVGGFVLVVVNGMNNKRDPFSKRNNKRT
ncbi:MAG: hypothetical protein ACKVKP_12710 [Acidimicrobiales bacterium]|jgi:TRAP-type mannitol/chloroaromatic compound transport system permease small subunit|tara:strand:+ start:586 stop:804 length:219 start_codon:yes stop_codon:yes gene_type:complete